MGKDIYENPLCERYASKEMQRIFSDDYKFSTWRKLWVALAESERELGLDFTEEQIEELRANIYNIDYAKAAAYEKDLRHDVMAHMKAYGDICPKAAGIIHVGATSSYVGDNTDLIRMREGLYRIKGLLLSAIEAAASFADKYKTLHCLAYTHFQPAQPTTVGKRATIWIEELLLDLEQLDFQLASLKFFGCKGTTGTGASFMELFDGDLSKVTELELRIAKKMGFDSVYPVSGQTYSRKIDYNVLSVLSGIAQSASKFATDIRLLSHLKEVDEPFEDKQVGSSAMAYKRNPMRSERICSLARYVICDALNPALTASNQWFERTLDDSANRRISIAEAFLAVDGILSLYINVISGLQVFPKVIAKHLNDELPFMATENILMHCVKKGGDRQKLHEAIRRHSVEAGRLIKLEGAPNMLLQRILDDPEFGLTAEELESVIDADKFIGFAPEQTEEFLNTCVLPVLNNNKGIDNNEIVIRV
jgi:adenylosuccinate lyase